MESDLPSEQYGRGMRQSRRSRRAKQAAGLDDAAIKELSRPSNGTTDPSCFRMTTEDTRTLVQMLDEAGVPRVESERDVRVSYRYEPPVALEPGPIENTVEIYIEPSFPHGAFTCSPCG